MPGDLRVEVVLTGAETDGRFCLLVDHPQPGWALPPQTIEAGDVVHEEFFLAAEAERPGEEPDLPRLLELAQRHGWRFSGA